MIGARRFLYPLRLQGVGTQDVEALPSYLIRLAASHGVSVNQLLRYIASVFPGQDQAAYRSLEVTRISTLCRGNGTTAFLVNVLTELGAEKRSTLMASTFLPLSGVLHRSRGIGDELRWCPVCLLEQLGNGDPPFIKLVWCLSDVEACRSHRVVLRNRCGKCQKSQGGMSRRSSMARCCHCGSPLFCPAECQEIALDSAKSAPDLVMLVGDMASDPVATFAPFAVSRYLKNVLNASVNASEEVARFRSLPYECFKRYANEGEPITLGTLRRIAYHLDIPIYSLLREGEGASRSFGFVARSSLARPGNGLGPRGKERREKVRKELLKRCDIEPIPLAETARQLGVSTGFLRYNFPEIVAQLSKLRRAARTAKANVRRHQAISLIKREIASWSIEHPSSISKKALIKLVRRNSGLPKHLLREVVQEILPDIFE